MNQVTRLSVLNILVLKTYLTSIYGDHWPLEIIQIICMLFYELFNVKVSCGYNHTCLVFDKQLYACGSNEYGQLGLDHNQHQNSPQKLNLPAIKKIICGGAYSIAVTSTNEVYVWGYNASGQLGLGHNQNQNSPQKLNLSPVKKIICGGFHSIAVTGEEKVRNAPFSNPLGKMREHFSSTATNEIYVWGSNVYGQLGLGHNQNQNSPQKLNLPAIKKIICGSYYSIAITTTNEVYVWGNNEYGQLGLGHNQNLNLPQKLNLPPVKKIICGSYHSIAITTTNKVYVWGSNESGQLGFGHNQNQNSPQKLNLPAVKKIICGGYHSVAITGEEKVRNAPFSNPLGKMREHFSST